MKTFMIGKDRSLKLGKYNNELIIIDKESKKEAVFTPARWASFRICLDEIDNQLYRLSQGVAYCNHYGRFRMDNVQGGYRQTTSRQPDRLQLHTVLPVPRLFKSAEHRACRECNPFPSTIA